MNNEELKKFQISSGLTVNELAKELGIYRTSLYRYIKGENQIPKSVELAIEAIGKRISEASNDSKIEKITLRIISSDDLNRFYKDFGKKVRSVRENKANISERISQEQLSTLADLSAPYISDIENGKSEVTLKTIQKLAKALEVEIEIIFTI